MKYVHLHHNVTHDSVSMECIIYTYHHHHLLNDNFHIHYSVPGNEYSLSRVSGFQFESIEIFRITPAFLTDTFPGRLMGMLQKTADVAKKAV